MKPRRLHSDTILSMSTIKESYLNGNFNNVMDRKGGVKKGQSSAFAAELG